MPSRDELERVLRVLSKSLSSRLTAEETEELVRRVRLQEESAAELRELPLDETEPLVPLPPEERDVPEGSA